MSNERAGLDLEENDTVVDQIRQFNKKRQAPDKKLVEKGGKASGFRSREVVPKAEALPENGEGIKRPVFVRPKRTEQMNFKVTEEIYSLFYACVQESGQSNIGSVIDEAILLLAEKYGVK